MQKPENSSSCYELDRGRMIKVNYHALVEDKVYIGGESALLQVLREQEITDVFDLRDNGTEAEGFPAKVTRHHYPIVEHETG